MKTFKLLPALVLFCVATVYGQHSDPSTIDLEKRALWIDQAMMEMLKINPDTVSNILEPEITDLGEAYYSLSYRLKKPGIIRFSKKDWIYLMPSSSHDDPEVGDITLAMNKKKKFFINEGHICGGIIHFMTTSRITASSSDQFFENFVSDTDSMPWKISASSRE